jgi:hypothetical protein
VIGWIDDGSVERRRVLLVDTKGRPHARGARARDARIGASARLASQARPAVMARPNAAIYIQSCII